MLEGDACVAELLGLHVPIGKAPTWTVFSSGCSVVYVVFASIKPLDSLGGGLVSSLYSKEEDAGCCTQPASPDYNRAGTFRGRKVAILRRLLCCSSVRPREALGDPGLASHQTTELRASLKSEVTDRKCAALR